MFLLFRPVSVVPGLLLLLVVLLLLLLLLLLSSSSFPCFFFSLTLPLLLLDRSSSSPLKIASIFFFFFFSVSTPPPPPPHLSLSLFLLRIFLSLCFRVVRERVHYAGALCVILCMSTSPLPLCPPPPPRPPPALPASCRVRILKMFTPKEEGKEKKSTTLYI